jgi:hypothetical protein
LRVSQTGRPKHACRDALVNGADEDPAKERGLAEQLGRELADVRRARNEADHVDVPAEANSGDRVVERARSADLDDVVDAAPVRLRTRSAFETPGHMVRRTPTIFMTSSSQFGTSR